MRIALVTDYYLPTLGGVQTVVKAHREELEALGHEVTVFTPLQNPSDDSAIVALPTAPFAPDGYPLVWPPAKTIALLRAEFAARRIDVVHIHTEMIGAVSAFRAARELGLPIVQTMHGRIDVYMRSVLPLPSLTTIPLAWLHRRYVPHTGVRIEATDRYTQTRLARRMWRLMVSQANQADGVIVPSQHFADKLSAQGVSSPISVISNGLEDSVLQSIGHPQPRLRKPGEDLRVIWVGRLSPEKRPEVLVSAMHELTGVRAEMFGDGIARRRVRRAVARTAANVVVRGSVAQEIVLQAMRSAHVAVSTSFDFDNQPMVILEAIASGLPVIVCDPDLAELLPHGAGAVAADPSPGALAAVLSAYRDDPERIRAESEATIAHAGNTAQKHTVAELLRVYRDAITVRAGSRSA